MIEPIYYPATYQAPIIRRLLSVSHIVLFLVLSFFGRAQLDLSSSKAIWIFAIIMLVAVAISKFDDSSSFIVLYADRIEKKSWFDTKIWRRDEVANLSLHSFGKFRLVRKYNKGDYFFIPAGIKRDATWNDWLRGVPEVSKYSGSVGEKNLRPASFT